MAAIISISTLIPTNLCLHPKPFKITFPEYSLKYGNLLAYLRIIGKKDYFEMTTTST